MVNVFRDTLVPPGPENLRMKHTWAIDFYAYMVSIIDCILIIVYMFTFYKAWKGTRYVFILILTVLLLLGNVGSLGAAISLHQASSMIVGVVDALSPDIIEQVGETMEICYIFAGMRDTCYSVAIWCFSFRYWNISYVMLVRLKD